MKLEKIIKDKIAIQHRSEIKFLEEYYSTKLNNNIRIEFADIPTSSYNHSEGIIRISLNNLIDMYSENPTRFYSLFYTLLSHEIGHAVYTNQLPYSLEANILEDNRIEYQIARWNLKANFKLMRYIFQDLKLNQYIDSSHYNDMHFVELALLRTVDNSKHVKQLATTEQRKTIVQRIILLNDEYKRIDTMVWQTPSIQTKLLEMHEELRELIIQLINAPEKMPDSQSTQKGEQGEPNDEDTDDEQDMGTPEDSEGGDAEEQDSDTQEAVPDIVSMDNELRLLQNMLDELDSVALEMKHDAENGVYILQNTEVPEDDYKRYSIPLFDTKRHSGIRGGQQVDRRSGNATQLNLNRYMRRGYVNNEKMFTKELGGVGGKQSVVNVTFFLDISGSMGGGRLRIAVDYLKSFYDTMHKYLNIQLYAFGQYTYKITRKELNVEYLKNRLEGSTVLKAVPLKRNEQVIVITDGSIDNYLPSEFRERAQFIIVDSRNSRQTQETYREMRRKVFVDSKNLVTTLNQATDSIRRYLK